MDSECGFAKHQRQAPMKVETQGIRALGGAGVRGKRQAAALSNRCAVPRNPKTNQGEPHHRFAQQPIWIGLICRIRQTTYLHTCVREKVAFPSYCCHAGRRNILSAQWLLPATSFTAWPDVFRSTPDTHVTRPEKKSPHPR